VAAIYEPTVTATIITPHQHCGAVMKLAVARRGTQLDYSFLGGTSSGSSSSSGSPDSSSDDALAAAAAAADTSSSSSASASSSAGGGDVGDRVLLRYTLPLSELAGDFYSRLKSATQG
jgi:translation elongation factor EF-G